jgi:hypothetical protein
MQKHKAKQTPLILQIILIATLLLPLSACSSMGSLMAAFRSTDHFLTLDSDTRILYEPGAEANARELVPLLPEAIKKIEEDQYLPFHDPIKIYVCASAENCYKLTGSRAPAIVTNKLFLSPVLFLERRPIDRYLTHQLSHLHLRQRLGMLNFTRLPTWFKEGLAEVFSGGATSFQITDQEAYKAIADGHNFTPDSDRNIISIFISPRYGNYWKISEPMFYRQSMLFVAFLKKTDEKAFLKMLMAIQHGEYFSTALTDAYNENLSALWNTFIEETKASANKSIQQTGDKPVAFLIRSVHKSKGAA